MTKRNIKPIWDGVKGGKEFPKTLAEHPHHAYSHKLSGTPFGQNPNNKEFIKLHLAQTKPNFYERPQNHNMPVGCHIAEITGSAETKAQIFLENLNRVGGPYGWANREKYQEHHMKDIIQHMGDPETQIYRFHDGKDQVGFCTISGIKPDWKAKPYEKGVNKMRAVYVFAAQEEIPAWPNPVEIYKFGIFPDQVGKGYGKVFLNALTQKIFKETNYNIIYLDTRDTNPEGAEHFYATQGFRVFYGEILPNDLVNPVPWPPSLTSQAKAANENDNNSFSPSPETP